MNSLVCNNQSSFIKKLATFTTINLSNYTQNLLKHIVNLDAYWCSVHNFWEAKYEWHSFMIIIIWCKRHYTKTWHASCMIMPFYNYNNVIINAILPCCICNYNHGYNYSQLLINTHVERHEIVPFVLLH
jgi:hypothetical protein